MDAQILRVKCRLPKFFAENNVDDSHGYGHAEAVELHVIHAAKETTLTAHQKGLLRLAALLHDVDDRKYFASKDYDNARQILKDKLTEEETKTVITMISLVSASKNKNTIPKGVPAWMLIPRWADRLESIGEIGVNRCLDYSREKGRPMHTDKTKRAFTAKELHKIATPERYQSYAGTSDSTIDHFYDKLLHVGVLVTKNRYLLAEAEKRRKVMIEFCLNYWNRHRSI